MARFIFLLFLVAVILAFKFLPWYVLVGLAVAFVLSMKFLGGKLLYWLFSLPFRAKGAALRRATVVVHLVEPCAAPVRPARRLEVDDEEEDEEDDGEERPRGTAAGAIDGEADDDEDEQPPRPSEPQEPWNHYRVETTITPGPPGSRQVFHHWEIGELRLTLPNQSVMSDCEDVCQIEELEVELDGRFVPDEGYKLAGPQKLRLVIAVKPGVERLQFHYYFERFGELVIPAAA